MDLKIASITLVNKAILLTRNSSDFGQIAGLSIQNWLSKFTCKVAQKIGLDSDSFLVVPKPYI